MDLPDGEQEISTNQVLERASEDRRLARVPERLRPYAFKAGESGNPGGRLKGTPTTITGMVKQAIEYGDGSGDLARDVAEQVADVLRNNKHRHFVALLREILDRTEGKAADHKSQLHRQIEEGIELFDRRSEEPVPLPLEDIEEGPPDAGRAEEP